MHAGWNKLTIILQTNDTFAAAQVRLEDRGAFKGFLFLELLLISRDDAPRKVCSQSYTSFGVCSCLACHK